TGPPATRFTPKTIIVSPAATIASPSTTHIHQAEMVLDSLPAAIAGEGLLDQAGDFRHIHTPMARFQTNSGTDTTMSTLPPAISPIRRLSRREHTRIRFGSPSTAVCSKGYGTGGSAGARPRASEAAT